MPRKQRAHGRPGTAVFPLDWATSHAVVVSKTLPDTCTISRPVIRDQAVFNHLTGQYTPTTVTPHFTGPCRLEGSSAVSEPVAGDEVIPTVSYQLVLERGAAPEARVDDVVVTGSGVRLIVTSVVVSSIQWEARLGCTGSQAS